MPIKISVNNSEYLKKINLKQEYPEDEEYEYLITKDEFNLIIKRHNYRNRILILILFGLMISSFILISISFNICITDTAQSNNVFTATIFLEMLRIDIYQYTILSLFDCIKEDISSIEILDIHSEAEIKFQDIFDHIKFLR